MLKKLSKKVGRKPKFIIKDTGKYGRGIFAGRDILKGEVITKFTGERITLEECLKRVEKGLMNNDDGFQISEEKYMVLDPVSILFNHSCNPNSVFRKEAELFAIRDIKKGEEITYDYSSTVGPNITADMWTMPCICGSSNCRETLSNVLTIPDKILRKYKKIEALQDYIIDQLNKTNFS